jgi:hypothetical protein
VRVYYSFGLGIILRGIFRLFCPFWGSVLVSWGGGGGFTGSFVAFGEFFVVWVMSCIPKFFDQFVRFIQTFFQYCILSLDVVDFLL